MTEELNKLYNQLYTNEKTKDTKTTIQLVEPDLNVIDTSEYTDRDDLAKATRILADYAIALQKDDRNAESIPFLEKAITRIENNPELIKTDIVNETLYESLVFHRGLAKYALKNYKEAKSDFKMLVEKDRTNAEYRTMHDQMVKMTFRKYEWILVALIVISAAASIYIGKKNLFAYRISYGVLIAVIIGFYEVGFLKKRQMIK